MLGSARYRGLDIMAFVLELGPTSATAVTLFMSYDFNEGKEMQRMQGRAQDGTYYFRQGWLNQKYRLPVEDISPGDAYIVNSWFDSGTELLLFITSGDTTDVSSLMIMNEKTPFSTPMMPYADRFSGVIELEVY
jgi:hypothetical protein